MRILWVGSVLVGLLWCQNASALGPPVQAVGMEPTLNPKPATPPSSTDGVAPDSSLAPFAPTAPGSPVLGDDTEPSFVERGYRKTLLLVDGVSFGAMTTGALLTIATLDAGFPQPAMILAGTGAGGLLLGGPVVHAAQGRLFRSLGSLTLRGASLVAWTMIGAASATCTEAERESGWGCWGPAIYGTFAGMFVGLPTGALLDMALLGNPEDEQAQAPDTALARADLRLSCELDLDSGSYVLLVGGRM
jgi:hypothetical protein